MAEFFPVTLVDAIAELKREARMREAVYSRLIATRKLNKDEASRRNDRLAYALLFLEQAHEQQKSSS